MKERIEQIIGVPIHVYGLLLTITVTAAVLGILVPALYAMLAAVVVFLAGAIVNAVVHPTLLKAYVVAVVILAVFAVNSGFDPFEYFAREQPHEYDLVRRGRSLLPKDSVRRAAARNLRSHYASSRARRRTL